MLDRRCYKKRQDLIMRNIKNGEGILTICKRKEREYEETTRGN
jgi:hypothetical protein